VVSKLPDLRDFVRAETVPPKATLIVRGGPDSAMKLMSHAERVRRAFVLDGGPVLGISVFAALDDIGPASLDGIQAGKVSTYRVVHLVAVGQVLDAGFMVLPTFDRPHVTLLLDTLERVETLLELLGPPQTNPRYGEMGHRVRRRPR
jgi:hypothetical protein